jgi:hypothetical protein
MYVLREKELRICREPTRKAPSKLRSKGAEVEDSAVAFAPPFVVSLRSELGPGSRAVPPQSQCAHTAWRIQDGVFSGAPNAITQTTDGYLWIGT